MKTILFLTTNFIWGGSEILWTAVAKRLLQQHYKVKAIAGYDFTILSAFSIEEDNFFLINKKIPPLTRMQRMRQKFGLENYSPETKLETFISSSEVDFAVVSQGNNTEGAMFMELLIKYKIRFVTITHLVVESVWPAQNDERIDRLMKLFETSLINFFVSKKTMQQHEKFLGYRCNNSEITYNPFTKQTDEKASFPGLINGNYCIALVGRLECFHKGYDLLIDIVKQDKWKSRNIVFSIYGIGPHRKLIERMLQINDVKNVVLKGQADNIADVWQQNHILMMPSRLEGQALTLTEAMRFKRAAIVTNVGGVKELIEHGLNGFVADYPQANVIDNTLEHAWNKRNNWEEMGLRAHHTILMKHPADATAYFVNQIKPLLDK